MIKNTLRIKYGVIFLVPLLISILFVGLPFIEILLLNYTNGYYNFTLTLNDVFGNTISDTVYVGVLIRNPADSGSSPSPSEIPPRFFDNPVVIGVTAGIIILGGGILILRRRA